MKKKIIILNNIKIIYNKPPNLEGTAFINPKNIKKNHSGIIFELVF